MKTIIYKHINDHFESLKKDYNKYISLNCFDDFGFPSQYFHIRAIDELNKDFLSESHIEMIYATLVSWGMHRMGKTKTKLVSYDSFKKSICKNRKELHDLKLFRIENLSLEEYERLIPRLSDICFNLRVSDSKSSLVANSKTLAHILPNLVPPIDRNYTVKFFFNKDLSKNPYQYKYKEESEIFKLVLEKTFEFIVLIKNNMDIKLDNETRTSYPKLFDNSIIGFIKNYK
ncbi:MAG: hypothetical protein JXQ69_06410 [Paludibacteraceae bacterium]|nr:hypothetical protein [Paludibacteraceae bacterium]MBN2787942.1 hypothetical protein [Paludibacteraceae bacterium]